MAQTTEETADTISQDQYEYLGKHIQSMMQKLDDMFHAELPVVGLTTGFDDFDEMTGGLEPELIVIASRPSMGKTALATDIALHMGIKNQRDTLFFSLDLTGEQLVHRMIASLCRIDSIRLKHGKLSESDWPTIASSVNCLTESKIAINDKVSNINQIRKYASSWAANKYPGLIVIDLLQMIPSHKDDETRYQNINEILIGLKSLSKELQVPIILLSQLSKKLEERADKRPVFSDFLDSDLTVGLADKIIFVYRDEHYNDNSLDVGTAEIIMAKNKNGVIGKIRLTCMPYYFAFENFRKQ